MRGRKKVWREANEDWEQDASCEKELNLLGNQSPWYSTFIQHIFADLYCVPGPMEGTGSTKQLIPDPKELTGKWKHNSNTSWWGHTMSRETGGETEGKPSQGMWNLSWAGKTGRTLQGSWKKKWRRRQKSGVGVLSTSEGTKRRPSTFCGPKIRNLASLWQQWKLSHDKTNLWCWKSRQ